MQFFRTRRNSHLTNLRYISHLPRGNPFAEALKRGLVYSQPLASKPKLRNTPIKPPLIQLDYADVEENEEVP